MKMSTRFVALALALCLLLSVFPAPAHAAENGNELTATEIPGLSRLETDKTAENVTQYEEDEMVTVIKLVKCDESSLQLDFNGEIRIFKK